MFTVYDREAPNSLRVLVVAKGEVVTSQDLSPKDAATQSKELLESAAIKVDSDQAADLALAYAAANNVKVTAMNFEMARQGAKAVPVWIVSCLDKNGGPLGSVVITASRGNVVASEGFPNAPGAASKVPPVLTSQTPLIRTAAIDPQVMVSDREFLAGQPKESAAPPIAAPPSAAEAPAPLSDVAGAAPPAPVESAPPVARGPEGEQSQPGRAEDQGHAGGHAVPDAADRQPKTRHARRPDGRADGRARRSGTGECAGGFGRSCAPHGNGAILVGGRGAAQKVHIGRFIRRILPF